MTQSPTETTAAPSQSPAQTKKPSVSPTILPSTSPNHSSIIPSKAPSVNQTSRPSISPIVAPANTYTTTSEKSNTTDDDVPHNKISTTNDNKDFVITNTPFSMKDSIDLFIIIAIASTGTLIVCLLCIYAFVIHRKKKKISDMQDIRQMNGSVTETGESGKGTDVHVHLQADTKVQAPADRKLRPHSNNKHKPPAAAGFTPERAPKKAQKSMSSMVIPPGVAPALPPPPPDTWNQHQDGDRDRDRNGTESVPKLEAIHEMYVQSDLELEAQVKENIIHDNGNDSSWGSRRQLSKISSTMGSIDGLYQPGPVTEGHIDPEDNIVLNDPLREWFRNVVGLPQYYNIFRTNGVDTLEFVKRLERPQDLEYIGVEQKGHQVIIMQAIKKLNSY